MFTCYHFVQSALAGWVAGVSFVLWISIGSMIYSTNKDSLPVPTAKCPNTTLMYKYVSSSLISSYLCCENNSLFNSTYYIGNKTHIKTIIYYVVFIYFLSFSNTSYFHDMAENRYTSPAAISAEIP